MSDIDHGIRRIWCALGCVALLCCSAATRVTRDDPAKVDLNLSVLVPGVAAGGEAVQVLTVTNTGESMRGRTTLTYVTPIFVNVDRAKPLPDGCKIYHEDQDFQVPEIVRCDLEPLAQDQHLDVSIPITVAKRAPAGPTFGEAIAEPADTTADAEQYITDNLAPLGVAVSRVVDGQVQEPGTGIDLYLSGSNPAISAGETKEISFVVGNRGTATTGPVRLDFTTPLYVNTSRAAALPAGCELLLKDPDPSVPEIVECSLPDRLEPGAQAEVRIPVELVKGGPLGQQFGIAITTADAKHGSQDLDGNLANNVYEPSVEVIG